MFSASRTIKPVDIADFDDLSADGVTVVTPNRRLAAALKESFDRAQQRAGRLAWVAPDILPLNTFFERTFRQLSLREAAPLPVLQLLDANQSALLWEQVIRKSAANDALLSISQTAKEASAAWNMAHQWDLLTPLRNAPRTEDAEAFLDWAIRYQQLMREKSLVDTAMLPDVLCDLLRHHTDALPKKILTHGFDIVTPQQQRFFATCESLGAAVETMLPLSSNLAASLKRTEFATEADELRACAAWARETLIASFQSSSSSPLSPSSPLSMRDNARIAIVVPDLRGKRSQMQRALVDALLPMARAEMRSPDQAAALFNISLGLPLSDYALVHDAMLCLEFSLLRPMPYLAFSTLLRSGFIAGAETEMAARASLDAAFREIAPAEISLPTLQKTLKLSSDARLQRAASQCRQFCETIDRVALLAVDDKGEGTAAGTAAHAAARAKKSAAVVKQTPHDWRVHFTDLLSQWRFPGERALGSTDFQVLAKFREAIQQLATLQTVQPRMRAGEALTQLRRIVADTVFQPESDFGNAPAPIQVLGILESAGQTFDALWITGLSDDTWPLAARPNAFLPFALQRKAGVTEASAEASLALDTCITDGWRQSAAEVIFSHAMREGGSNASEQQRAASALIRDVPLVSAEIIVHRQANFAEALQAMNVSAVIEKIPDLPFTPLPNPTTVGGGASVIRDQAACPFRAFARHRLGAKPLPQPAAWLDAAERGILLHRVLSLVWTRLGSQTVLLAMDEHALQALVGEYAAQAIAEAHRKGAESLTGRFAQLEHERLSRIVIEWLMYERTRAPFTMEASEDDRQIRLSSLSMKLRLDRMDRLEDGTHALIDYKTGDAKIKSWLGDRPDEPQLPLYFCTTEQHVSALAFARLKRGKPFGFEGVSAAENILPNVSPIETKRGIDKAHYVSWDVLVAEWETSLERLADQFANGIAVVDPKNGALTCQQCDLQGVCRVAEQAVLLRDEGGFDEG